jgi:hypothetical protein
MRRFFLRAALCAALAILLLPGAASAQTALVIKPLIEKKAAVLPAGELFWRIENLPTVDAARAAAMQVSSSGTTGLQSLVMFVVDAGKPFSSPGTLP